MTWVMIHFNTKVDDDVVLNKEEHNVPFLPRVGEHIIIRNHEYLVKRIVHNPHFTMIDIYTLALWEIKPKK